MKAKQKSAISAVRGGPIVPTANLIRQWTAVYPAILLRDAGSSRATLFGDVGAVSIASGD